MLHQICAANFIWCMAFAAMVHGFFWADFFWREFFYRVTIKVRDFFLNFSDEFLSLIYIALIHKVLLVDFS
jgi:hypothetical protein